MFLLGEVVGRKESFGVDILFFVLFFLAQLMICLWCVPRGG